MNLVIYSRAGTAEAADMDEMSESVQRAMESARTAQRYWASGPLRLRLKIIRRVRHLIADEAESLARAANEFRQRPLAEILSAEVLPLADACRFLDRESRRILRTRRLGRSGRPLWLAGVESEVRREPHGLVLIIGPGNYPLFLPAVQMLQALAAGNAVLLKPGDHGSPAALAFLKLLNRAGLPHDLVHLLPEASAAAQSAIALRVDKVVLTGSATTGEEVLAQCAKTLTPVTAELSGCDAFFVRADADLDLVVRALRFGLRLNGGATCIAPRRVFVHHTLAAELEERLRSIPFETSLLLDPLLLNCVTDALIAGADLIAGGIESDGRRLRVPLILSGVAPSMQLVHEDIFAPVLSLISVVDDAAALEFSAQCQYSLGAAIFSRDDEGAQDFADQVRAGVVVINDLIVPTADPRVPFGGRGRSGFGSTRGAEGLLEMTVPKVVSVRHGKSHRHFHEPQQGDSKIFGAYIRATHGKGWRTRFSASAEIFRAVRQRLSKPDFQ